VNVYFGGGLFVQIVGDGFREARDDLSLGQRAGCGIDIVGDDCVAHFGGEIGVFAVGGKCEVPGANAGGSGHVAVRCEGVLIGVEGVDVNLVGAKIACVGEFSGGVGIDGMEIGMLLPRRIGARAGVRLHAAGRGRSERAVRIDAERGNRIPLVIGDQQRFVGGVEGDMHGTSAMRGLRVEELEFAGGCVDGKCRSRSAGLVRLRVDGVCGSVEKSVVVREHEKIGIWRFERCAHRGDVAGDGIEAVEMNAAGLVFGRSGDVHPKISGVV
jgi:hypothetical protein